ncbi:hypothetical protein [uncultured Sulfitobacter sp.]|uniref:hypothetical protein n=1 Tax=uncultured Sulfitobacter sp. TaxID=191468 RepID=UPI0026137294|nr:hypothetical protein [uncultured Sulfitobacter sp.]
MTHQGQTESLEGLTIVGDRGRFPKVTLVEPTKSGYLLLAAEVDHRPPFMFGLESSKKRKAKSILKAAASESRNAPGLIDANVFRALLLPPGRKPIRKTWQAMAPARFDLVFLLEFDTPASAAAFEASQTWQDLETTIEQIARRTLSIEATNARRIGSVDHSKDGIFLFNFFVADELERNLSIWEYTAGWFEDQTGLNNSTLLIPAPVQTDHTVINHCRWDSLSDILPSLLFKRSFHTFVLANFSANATTAMPILYSRA